MITHSQNRPGPVLGILGGGQLALMLSHASAALGITTKLLVQKPADALPGLAGEVIVGNWNDPDTVLTFARTVDVVTLENEFVNPSSLAAIESAGISLLPSLGSIQLIQDKWTQKEALIRAGIPVVPCASVRSPLDVTLFASSHGWPVVLKRRHMGYDGKGNATVHHADELAVAWESLSVNDAGLYVEAFCPFERELAVMVCRSRKQTAVYPVVDTVQSNHICHIVKAPSSLPSTTADEARTLAMSAIEVIDGLGTMGVELFLRADGHVLVNELAPRVHNSGHYTIEACACSQFENHIRACMDLPLGPTAMVKPHAVMVNLLGAGAGPAWPDGYANAAAIPGAHLHLYGKSASAKGRKMGHITALGNSAEEAMELASRAAKCLRFGIPD